MNDFLKYYNLRQSMDYYLYEYTMDQGYVFPQIGIIDGEGTPWLWAYYILVDNRIHFNNE